MSNQPSDKVKTAKAARHSWFFRIVRAGLIFFGALFILFAISNLLLSPKQEMVDHLAAADKAYITEALHLRATLGDCLWPGWAQADIASILYNRNYAFLIGATDPAPGWLNVPGNTQHGGNWQITPNDSLSGKKYYRMPLKKNESPQAFTVKVGNQWAASMTLKEYMITGMGDQIRDHFPTLIKYFIPYRLIAKIFLGLALNTDGYICAIEHEAFHAYQGITAPDQLLQAETMMAEFGNAYPWNDSRFNDAWRAEIKTLAGAMTARNDSTAIVLTRKFLSLREDRRQSASLDSALVRLEQLREWEEGLAKYTELAIWKNAAGDTAYHPDKSMNNVAHFDGYKLFANKWLQELMTLRMQPQGDEIRFYYAGMAEGFLLDRLYPDWKAEIFIKNVSLENLLKKAVNATAD